jgi:hypothetical protein
MYAVSSVIVAVSLFFAGFYIGSLSEEDEPQPYPSYGEVLVEDLWEADSFIPPDTYSNTHGFRLKQGVSRLVVAYDINLPSIILNDTLPYPTNITINPSVTLRLRGPDNEIVWNFTTNETLEGDVPFTVTKGVWTLRIEAIGHGLEEFELSIRDTALITVTAF